MKNPARVKFRTFSMSGEGAGAMHCTEPAPGAGRAATVVGIPKFVGISKICRYTEFFPSSVFFKTAGLDLGPHNKAAMKIYPAMLPMRLAIIPWLSVYLRNSGQVSGVPCSGAKVRVHSTQTILSK